MGGSGGPTGGPSKGLGGGGSDGALTGGPGGGENQCQLTFRTTLFGPVPGVANHLTAGEVLSVALTGPAFTQVGLFTAAGAQAGSIAGARQLMTLIACLQAGVPYSADVISAHGSAIIVQVRNA